jgi:hypothetical protein
VRNTRPSRGYFIQCNVVGCDRTTRTEKPQRKWRCEACTQKYGPPHEDEEDTQ